MEPLSERLRELGRTVSDVSDRRADPATLQRARKRWMAPAPAVVRHGRQRWAILAAAACIAMAAWLWLRRGPVTLPAGVPLSFQVGVPPVPGNVGDWVAADAERPNAVRFSEGSELALAPGARLRVTETTDRGGSVLLERGSVHASIAHRDLPRRWLLRAGPFEVRVTGTVFDASWDPAAEVFELRMEQGSVAVSGPLLPPERSVVAGERLVVSLREPRMQLTTAAADPAPAPEAPPQDSASVEPTASGPPSASPSSGANETARRRSWATLAAAGKHREAMAALDAPAFAAEIERASAAELLTLADAARFGGHPARAREALLAMRRRFGATGRSAFLLGKIAADQGGGGDAVTWFETYLREEPGGPLAEQALGRILDIKKHGDPGSAREVAERYLARYPNGAYAELARRLAAP